MWSFGYIVWKLIGAHELNEKLLRFEIKIKREMPRAGFAFFPFMKNT